MATTTTSTKRLRRVYVDATPTMATTTLTGYTRSKRLKSSETFYVFVLSKTIL